MQSPRPEIHSIASMWKGSGTEEGDRCLFATRYDEVLDRYRRRLVQRWIIEGVDEEGDMNLFKNKRS